MLKLREYVITVDHFSIWKRHLAWAMEDGKDLRDYLTQRYASSMVFMSLLLSAELGVLFNSAPVTTTVRSCLMTEQVATLSFWTGMMIIVSSLLTILGLISTFTAWTMVSAVSPHNAHCIFRSSIGQYAAELPGRFIVGAIYSFMIWLIMFFFLLLPLGFWSFLLLIFALTLFIHTITAFSAFGRIIMHTGAMGSNHIFEPEYEMKLAPHSLHANLLTKARANLSNKTSIMRQYRSKQKPINQIFSEDEMSTRLSEGSRTPDSGHVRKRTNSLVKFADGYDTNGDAVALPDRITAPYMGTRQMSPLSDAFTKPPRHNVPASTGPTPLVNNTTKRHDVSKYSDWLNHQNDTERGLSQRTESAVSSLGDIEESVLTDEERFEREYGDLFGPDYHYSEDESDQPEYDAPKAYSYSRRPRPPPPPISPQTLAEKQDVENEALLKKDSLRLDYSSVTDSK